MAKSAFKEVAIKAAIRAGKYAKRNFGKTHKISYKGRINIVTEIDRNSEKMIVKLIRSKFPDHSILSEEMGQELKSSQYKWVIDPLDATTNYSHGFPFFCISIALEKNNEIILGVVYDPIREELFTAQRQKGAFLNNRRINVSRIRNLSKGLLATGFPYRVKEDRTNLKHFENFIVSAQAVRRAGSAALDLCYVACGRFDGFWEIDLHPWDTAAASLIAEEAKGMVSDFHGRKYSIYSNRILASNGKIHDQMIKVLNRKTGASFHRKR